MGELVSLHKREEIKIEEVAVVPRKKKRNTLFDMDLPGEVWKKIPNTYGMYEVSNEGRVRKLKCCDRYGNNYYCLIVPAHIGKGYQVVKIFLGEGISRTVYLHKLVKATFEPTKEKKYVHHKDGNRFNNSLKNLSYSRDKKKPILPARTKYRDFITSTGKLRRRTSPLSIGDYQDILSLLRKKINQGEIAKKFGVSQPTISRIKKLGIRKIGTTAVLYHKSEHELRNEEA